MTRLRVICTNPDQSVAIIAPAPDFLELCRLGIVAHSEARGEPLPLFDVDYEVAKFVREPGWRPDLPDADREALARRRIRALNDGGLTEREAVQLIADCDAPAGSFAREIVDMSEVPNDRTYRNAWRRSLNGGPIYIDQQAAREIRDARRAA